MGMGRYRVIFTDEWRLRLVQSNATILELEDTPANMTRLRRKAEEHAGAELDWVGGTVQPLGEYRDMTTLWEAKKAVGPVVPLPVAV